MEKRNGQKAKPAKPASRPAGRGRSAPPQAPPQPRPAPAQAARRPVPPPPKKRKRRRGGNNTVYYILTVIFVLALAITLSLTVFFKIGEVVVTGTSRYPSQQLIGASGVKVGDNLLRVNEDDVAKRLGVYPYVEAVALKREFPPRINIVITEATPLAAIGSEGSYTLVSRQGRILETALSSAPEGVLTALGPGILGGDGEPVREEQQEYIRMLLGLSDAIESNKFQGITTIDVTDRLNIVLSIGDKVTIQLGSERELDYKLRQVKRVMDELLDPDFRGTLDATTPGEVRSRPYHDNSELIFEEDPAASGEESAASGEESAPGAEPQTPPQQEENSEES